MPTALAVTGEVKLQEANRLSTGQISCSYKPWRMSGSRWYVCVALAFTARRYASAVYAVVVCPSVRPSHAGVVSKRLNAGSRKQRHTHRDFPDAKDLDKIPTGSPQRGRQMEMDTLKLAIFDQYLAISQKQCKMGT